MFGFRKITTNEECDKIAIKGKLEGLNHYYLSLLIISNDPSYRGNLSEELKRVETEIKINNQKLVELNNNL